MSSSAFPLPPDAQSRMSMLAKVHEQTIDSRLKEPVGQPNQSELVETEKAESQIQEI